jgi:hypothetical protein
VFAWLTHLDAALQALVMALLTVAGGYAITWLRSSAIYQKVENATEALQRRLALLVGQKTLAEAEAILESTLAKEVARLTGLPEAEVIVIGKEILQQLFPPAPSLGQAR